MRRLAPILLVIMLMPLTDISNLMTHVANQAFAQKHGMLITGIERRSAYNVAWYPENGWLVFRYNTDLTFYPLRTEVDWLLGRITNN